MLSELSPLAGAVLPLAAFRDHLRLGTGFGTETVQDGVLEGCLRASLALIERRLGVIVLRRGFRVSRGGLRDRAEIVLPVAPVVSVEAVRLVDGAEAAVPLTGWGLAPDGRRLVARGLFPVVPPGGRIEIDLTAGHGTDWAGVPADLAAAVLMQAAGLYEGRDGSAGVLPGVEALLAPWRPVRLGAAP